MAAAGQGGPGSVDGDGPDLVVMAAQKLHIGRSDRALLWIPMTKERLCPLPKPI
jgi:hypothetical protein